MPVYRIIDDHVLSEDEYREKQPEIVGFLAARAAGRPAVAGITFNSTKSLSFAPVAPGGAPAVTATPIGRGLPLVVEIREFYTGFVHYKRFLGPTGDTALISAVKNWGATLAGVRALNYVAKRTGQRQRFTQLSAAQNGSTIVAYTPAVTVPQIDIGFELAAAAAAEGGSFFGTVSSAFGAAAGLPIALPYKGLLLAAGGLTRIAGDLADALSDQQHDWDYSVSLFFDKDFETSDVAGMRLVAKSDDLNHRFSYRNGVGLVDHAGTVYAGDEPYVVISLSGREQPTLEGFTAQTISADFAARLLAAGNGGLGAALGDIVDAAKLLSDVKFREKAITTQERLNQATTDAQKASLKAELDGYTKNILTPELRP